MALSAQEQAQLEALRSSRGVSAPPPSPAQQAATQAQTLTEIPRIPTTMDLLQKYMIEPLTTRLPQNIISSLPDIGESGGEIAGMLEGARRGMAMPGGPAAKITGTAIGGTLGAMWGSATGETLRQLFQGESDPLKVIDKALESGLFSSAGEIVSLFGFAGRGIEKLRNKENLTAEEITSLDELQKGLESIGITLTPAQLTNSGFQQTLEKVAISGFGGEAKFGQLYEAQEEFIRDKLQQLVKQTGNPDRKITGQMFQGALEEAEDNLIKWAEPKYKHLDSVARDVRLSMQSTEQTLRNAKKKAMVDRRPGAPSRLDSEVEQMYDYVLGNTRNLSFESLFDTISYLTREQRKVTSRIDNRNPTLEKAYRDTIESLLGDAKKAVEASGDKTVMDLYDEVTGVYRESLKTLNDKALKGIVDTHPEFVGEELYRTGNVSSVEAAFKAVDEAAESAKRVGQDFDAEQIKNNIRAGYLRQLFVKAEVNETSTEAAAKLLRQLEGDDRMGDTFAAVLTPQQIGQVKRVLGWATTLEKQSAGNFSLIVRGRQSGALNKAASEIGDAGAGIGFSPFVLASAATMVASPLFLASRAINGKASSKNLAQLKDFVTRYDAGKLDAGDISSFFLLLANDASESDAIPPELKVPNLSPKETFEYHALKAQRAQRGQQIEQQQAMP
jgi:hypothetical protein